MSQQALQEHGESLWSEYKGRIISGFAIVLALVILFCPLIPEQYTIVGHRRSIQYDSSLGWYSTAGSITPVSSSIRLNVINKDSIDGDFSVTFSLWITTGQTNQLVANSSINKFILAGASQIFDVPNNCILYGQFSLTRSHASNGTYSLTYSVSTLSVPHNATQTEYKSIFTLAFGS